MRSLSSRACVVLDAAAFDVLAGRDDSGLRGLLRRAVDRGGEVYCPAVILAEVCRGTARTRRVETVLARGVDGDPIRIVPTDQRLATMVGDVLYRAKADSAALADAHVVAVAASVAETAVVVTADPGDILRLSASVPAARIVTRHPARAGRGNVGV